MYSVLGSTCILGQYIFFRYVFTMTLYFVILEMNPEHEVHWLDSFPDKRMAEALEPEVDL